MMRAHIVLVFLLGAVAGFLLRPWLIAPDRSTRSGEEDVQISQPESASSAPPSASQLPVLPVHSDEPPNLETHFTPERGDGVIRGIVHDADGDPVSGARIEAIPIDAAEEDEPSAWELDRRAFLQQSVDRFDRQRSLGGTATSGSDGSYAIGSLARLAYRVLAHHPEWSIEPESPARHSEVVPDSTVDFVATRQTRLSVDVIDQNDAPSPHARLHFQTNGVDTTRSWSPQRREIAVPPADYEAWAEAGDSRSQPRKVQIAAGRENTLTFQLEARTGIRGRVVADGKPASLDRVWVQCARVTPGAAFDAEHWRTAASKSGSLVPPRLTFELLDLEPGEYHVGIGGLLSVSSTGPRAIEVVRVEPGQVVDVLLHLETPPDERLLRVHVLDADGQPIEGADFQITWESGEISGFDWITALVADDGTHLLELPDAFWAVATGEQEGVATLITKVSDQGPRKTRIAVPPGSEVTVRYEPKTQLDLTVLGIDPASFDGALSATLTKLDGDASEASDVYASFSDVSARIEPEGNAAIASLQPGRHRLEIRVATQYLNLLEQTFDLAPGDNELTVTLPPLYELAVSFPDGRSRSISLNQPSGGNIYLRAQAARSGRQRFRGIPPGDYLLRAQGADGPGVLRVRIPADREVVFEPRSPNALLVTLNSRDAPPAELGFEDGDLIIGLGDTEFETYDQIALLLNKSFRGEVTLIVLRNGSRRTITCNPSDVLRSSKFHRVTPTLRD